MRDLVATCYQCGKCSDSCPLGELIPNFSPRYIASDFLWNEKITHKTWWCLTCDRCSVHCPNDITFSDFILNCRINSHEMARQKGFKEAHFGYFTALSRLMANENVHPNKWDVIPKNLEFSKPGESDILFFMGCIPLISLESHARQIGVNLNRTIESSLRLLNKMGIKPMILNDEKCCGHDSLWQGDVETFEKLSVQNIKAISDSGAETVITTCAECYRTMKLDYERYHGKLDFKIISFAEFLNEKIKSGELEFKYEYPRVVTYHDPCRMGRQLGVYEAPREVIRAIPGVKLVEMKHNRRNAQCCGVSAWNNCNVYTKYLRTNRLIEAEQIIDLNDFITTCPKCEMHLTCLEKEYENKGQHKFNMNIIDLADFVAKAMYLVY